MTEDGAVRQGGWCPTNSGSRRYTVQFGFGGEYQLEIWREIEEYGSYDRLDEGFTAHLEEYAAFFEVTDVLEFGPTRLMGERPESQFSLPED